MVQEIYIYIVISNYTPILTLIYIQMYIPHKQVLPSSISTLYLKSGKRISISKSLRFVHD